MEIKSENLKEFLELEKENLSKNPFFDQNKKQIIFLRGKVADRVITLEESFDIIISKVKPSTKIVSLRFKDRKDLIEKIVKGLDKNLKFLSKDFFSKLSRFYHLRNLFAHAPVTDLDKKLFFKDKGMYFENSEHTKGKTVQELSNELVNLLKFLFLLNELFKILQLILKKDENYKKMIFNIFPPKKRIIEVVEGKEFLFDQKTHKLFKKIFLFTLLRHCNYKWVFGKNP